MDADKIYKSQRSGSYRSNDKVLFEKLLSENEATSPRIFTPGGPSLVLLTAAPRWTDFQQNRSGR